MLGALCVFLAVACVYDYRDRRIPNYLVIVTGVVGAVRLLATNGWSGLLTYLGISALVMAVSYPIFKIGGLGAGDVKLLGVVAGYLPFKKILVFLFFSLLFAAILSLFQMWKRNHFTERVKYFAEYLADVMRSGSWKLYFENEADKAAVGICLSGPILASVLLYMGGGY